MTVVAHHPVVVHLERIGIGFLAVDVDAVIAAFQLVTLVSLDATLVDGQVVVGQGDGLSFCRNPEGAVVVAVPLGVEVQRIDVASQVARFAHDAAHQLFVTLKGFQHLLGEGQVIDRCVGRNAQCGQERRVFVSFRTVGHQPLVVVADAQFAEHAFGNQRAGGLHKVVELKVFGVLCRFPVNVYLSVLDLQGIARQTHTTLHVVFAAVDGTHHHLAVHLRVGADEVASGVVVQVVHVALLLTGQAVHVHGIGIHAASFAVGQVVEVFHLVVEGHGVAGGEVEYHDVVQLHFTKTGHTLVFPLRPFDVRFASEYGQRVLCQRHGQGRVGHARSVAHLAHVQEVAHQQ